MEPVKFIVFLWEDEKGERKVFECDFPNQFNEYFKDKQVAEVGGLFIAGNHMICPTFDKAKKIVNG